MKNCQLLIIFIFLLIFSGCDNNSTKLDETIPDVFIIEPENNADFESGQVVTILVEATDNKGIEIIEFMINGGIEHEDDQEPYLFEWDTSNLTGSYSLMAKARDTSGNTGLSNVVTINLECNCGNMVFVQGGSFEMGSHYIGTNSNELPVHTVTVNSFYILPHEVTQYEYSAAMGSNPAYGYGEGDNYPVYNVNWYDAVEYCNTLSIMEGLTPCYDTLDWSCDFCSNGFRLPTEAEWEYAARGGIYWEDDYIYSGTSENLVDYAWYEPNSADQSYEVETKLPNQLSIYDMSGNVYEWCNDWLDNNYYETSPEDNPHGPESGNIRILRGGSWEFYQNDCRVANRYGGYPCNDFSFIGFRIVRAFQN